MMACTSVPVSQVYLSYHTPKEKESSRDEMVHKYVENGWEEDYDD